MGHFRKIQRETSETYIGHAYKVTPSLDYYLKLRNVKIKKC